MVDGVEFGEDLEEHFFDLALSYAVFHFEVEGLITGYDRSLEEGLGEFEEGFAAVFDFYLFGFVLLFRGGKNDVLLIFRDLSHDFILLSSRLFHLSRNLLKGVPFFF
jgi:hypothetical protein